MNPPKKAFAGCLAAYGDSDAVLFGAPFETGGLPQAGTAVAPFAIRDGCWGLETYSPYLRADIGDYKIFDAGDLDLPPGDAARALDAIESFCGKVFDDGKMPVMVGGEQIVAFGAVRAAAARCPNLAVLHFGAHAGLKREWRKEPLAAQTVIRRIWELVGDGRIFQFGVRSGGQDEFSWAMDHVRIEAFDANSIDSCAEAIISRPIYITVDLDVINPSELPGAPLQEAGGMSFRSLHDALTSLRGFDVVGFDICGLAPNLDPSGASTALSRKLLREMLIAFSPTR
ncbi:MAG: agmatinase [Synergistaceae bacterium]|jgi:agmatinase|nr:agmatinase [Synergistaceae bacterium]